MKQILSLIILVVLGCSGQPSREKFPGPEGETTDFKSSKANLGVLGGFDPATQRAEVRNQASIRGVIRLGKNLKLPKKSYLLFVSARPQSGGAPLAVKRMSVRKFPLRFSLTDQDKMIQGRVLAGPVLISARLVQVDESGRFDPLQPQTGDAYGMLKSVVGEQNVQLIIDSNI